MFTVSYFAQLQSAAWCLYILQRILDRRTAKNNRGYVIEHCKTEQLKQSFFVRTVIERNQLDTATVRADTSRASNSHTVAFSTVCYAEQALHRIYTDTYTDTE